MSILSTLKTFNCLRSSLAKKSFQSSFQTPAIRFFKYQPPKTENSLSKIIPELNPKPKLNSKPNPNLNKSSDHQVSSLLKCYLFTGGFCGSLFVGSSIWYYENIKDKLKNIAISTYVAQSWQEINYKEGNLRQEINRHWNSLTDGAKAFYLILFLNFVAFGCWKIPICQEFMLKYFLSNPISKTICWPMVLSTFSHHSFIHLAMNMYVMSSFCPIICDLLGKEQFLGFYLGAGIVSSLSSSTLKFLTRSLNPSLGASGAILGLIGYFCSRYPDEKLSIVFLPQVTFSSGNALFGILGLDILGILLRWKLFDHAAHLGGTLFGIFYFHYGNSLIWCHKNLVIDKWIQIKQMISR